MCDRCDNDDICDYCDKCDEQCAGTDGARCHNSASTSCTSLFASVHRAESERAESVCGHSDYLLVVEQQQQQREQPLDNDDDDDCINVVVNIVVDTSDIDDNFGCIES